MITAIDSGILTTDLDAGGFKISNLNKIIPPPPNLVLTTDSRLSDARAPLDGSVTNASIAADAAIDQGKLNLGGVMPSLWLGTTAQTAAQGDLAEYKSNKGIADGYAALDNTGKVPAGQLPSDVGTGTVTSIGLTMPAQFAISGSPVTASGVFAITWANVVDGSWFGNITGAPAPPAFSTSPIPVALVPNLDASKVTTGTIPAARLPAAVGVGGSHAPGAVPDPGASGTSTDYLGRDMAYHALPSIGPTYQPAVPNPVLTGGPGPGAIGVVVSESLSGVSLFYKITPTTQPTYIELTSSNLTLPSGQTLSVYGAKAGYTNSGEVTLAN